MCGKDADPEESLAACMFVCPGLSELVHLCKDKVLQSSAPAEHSFPSCLATGWLDAETKQGATKQHEKKGSKRSAFKNKTNPKS